MMSAIYTPVCLFVFVTSIWLLSVAKKDASVVDRFWGLLFVFLSIGYTIFSDYQYWRSFLTLGLVSIWGIRLSLHIHLRNRNHGEDVRYQVMRKKHGNSFWWYSLFSVFLLQGFLALVISAPLYAIHHFTGTMNILWTDIAGVTLWTIGFIFEVGGDWQLKRFKANPENKGKLLTTGFWSLTRHPNYFGDACLWWGFFALACSVEYGWISIFGPAIMTFFLRYVSGVSLLEKNLIERKSGYSEYIKSTPAFFPRLWPRRF